MGARSPLRSPDFRRLWVGQTVSAAGDQIFPVATAVAVLDRGGDAADVGIVLAARFTTLALFVLLGGVFADRLPRRQVMIAADAARFVSVGALALSLPHVSVPVLAAMVAVVGAGEAFFQPAYAALIPTVLDTDDLERANALTSLSRRGASILGPALGGVLVAASGPTSAYALDAGTFLVSLLTLLRVAEPALPRAPRRSVVADVGDGVRAVRARPWVASILATASFQLMLSIAPCVVLLPIVSRERWGGDVAYGALNAMFAVGGVVGALVAARWRPRRPGLVGLLTLAAYGFEPLALLTAQDVRVAGAAAFLAGLGVEPFIVYWSTALARDVPPELLARVSSLDWLASFALMPLGLALTGPAIDAWGRGPVLTAATVLAVVPNLLLLAVPGVLELRTPLRSAAPSPAGDGGRVAAR